MTNKPQELGAQGTLQRGKACLRCRQVLNPSSMNQAISSPFDQKTKDGNKPQFFFSPFISYLCIIRGVTASSPLANSARRLRKPTGVSMMMGRARLALKSFEKLSSNSNIGSESLKTQNIYPLLSHYSTPTFIRAQILHPRLLGLLKVHIFQHQCLIPPSLLVRVSNLVTSNELIVI